jgi:coenzyme F420 hydrogenase subunit beta
MRRFEGLADIVENGFCTSCGLCTLCAPEGVIQMGWAANGQLRPRPARALTPDEDAAIVRLCPGVTQQGPFTGPDAPHDAVWGPVGRVVWAWAADPQTRLRASTGGAMSAVNRMLLESGRAAFILQVRAGTGLSSEPVLVREPDDLLTGSASRYASSAPLTAVREALALGEPFAVSLKPCDVAGLRNLQREDERARRLIVFTQVMVCGSVPSRQSTLAVLERAGMDMAGQEPVSVRWRGDGCPGPTVAVMPDGREVRSGYLDMWVRTRWTTQFRCKVCPDAIGLGADLVAADAWPGATPQGESVGTNVVFARSPLGEEVLALAERAGHLVTEPAPSGALDEVQPHQVTLRRTVAARLAGAIAAGAPAPDFAGLGEALAGLGLSAQEQAAVFAGTLERVRAGGADESTELDNWQPVLEEGP